MTTVTISQPFTAQPIRAQSTPIIIGELQASARQLAAKHTMLFEQIPKDISLLTVEPAGEEGEQQLERGDRSRPESISPAVTPAVPVDPVMGQYSVGISPASTVANQHARK